MTSQVAVDQVNLGGKYMFFQLLSTIQVNLVAKIMQRAYLCVIFHVKHKKNKQKTNKKKTFLAVLTSLNFIRYTLIRYYSLSNVRIDRLLMPSSDVTTPLL